MAVLVLGAQWGDEGKGKIVDVLSEHTDVVVRYGGGANAGHTLVVAGQKTVIRLVPSGILHPNTVCCLGNGMVIDFAVLQKELSELETRGVSWRGRVWISEKAHLVLPHHMEIDGLREQQGGIGTTKRGIGPAYEDKARRKGIRVGDLLEADLEARLARNLEGWASEFTKFGAKLPTVADVRAHVAPFIDFVRPLSTSVDVLVRKAERDGKRVLLEGAQGALLDVDHGTYPFVTSSSAGSAGAILGSGLSPQSLKRIIGITKAYATRVGNGPFPSELHDETGEAIRERGFEFGAVTGRPRRTGWLDLVALKYAVDLNGVTALAMTKLDVLAGLAQVCLCVGYQKNGVTLDYVPARLENATPVWVTLSGWSEQDFSQVRTRSQLSQPTLDFLARVEAYVGVPVEFISLGPGRESFLGNPNLFG